jgi:rod shape-determining protein MreC
MAVLDIRQRTGWLFFAVIVGHIILISAQVNTRRGVPMLEAIVFGGFAEVQRAATSVVTGVQDNWNNYFALQQIRHDNEQLTREVTEMRVALQQERALASQTRLLQQLLDLRTSLPLSTTAGNVTQSAVIGGGPSPAFRTITIDKGSHEGIRQDMAVIAPAGVVGRVIMPSARAAKVQLLIDSNAAAGAMVERTRAQGVAVGTGTDRLQMDYVPGSADVKAGDQVVTSGIDGIYPKGLVIGQIESVQGGTGDSRMIVIRPAVDFSALEAVLVVLTPPSAVPPDTEVSRTGAQTAGQAPAEAPRTEPSTQPTPDAPGAPERDESGNVER